LILGKLVRRNFGKIVVNCKYCGTIPARDVNCAKCARLISLDTSYKDVEKGVDVQIAMALLLDAINENFDVAYIVSSDADFVPVIKHVINICKKEVIYCHFPRPFTSNLVQACSKTKLIEKELIEKHHVQ
jgi:uncharacterized LabA/DUF88 family protein